MSYELSVANIALSDYCVTRAGLLFLLRCALRSLVWKGKSNIELRIESEGGIWKIQCKLPPKTKRFCPLVLK